MAESAPPQRRVHPASIAITALRSMPILGLAWFLLVEDEPEGSAVWLIGGLIVLTAGVAMMAFLGWRRLVFGFDSDGDFRLNSGVVYQKQRRLALSRLQSVDIVKPLVARPFGMASVRIEVAGDAAAVVEYLPQAQAEALRAEVLARSAGAASDTDPDESALEELLRVPTGDLLASLLLRSSTMLALLITTVGTAGVVVLTGFAGLLIMGFGVFVPLASVIAEFTAFYGFTVARGRDGLRITSGLLSTRAQTVPPGRVHAIELSQPLLWRRRGWVRVSMNIAGTGPRTDGERGSALPDVLLPVANRADALRILAELLPQWGIEGVDFDPAPAAAARRALLEHRQLGVAATPNLLLTRRGRIVRRTAAVPHRRVQSVRLMQGPWQRALGLATVRADTVPGSVRILALHRSADSARALADDLARRMRRARAEGAAADRRDGAPPAQVRQEAP